MFKRNKLNAAVLSVIAASAAANTYAEIDEIIVTATKRSESLQDVSIAVQAVTEETMDQLGVSNFEDYLTQLPGVTAGGSGPGQNTIYIRGVASTTPNLTTAVWPVWCRTWHCISMSSRWPNLGGISMYTPLT